MSSIRTANNELRGMIHEIIYREELLGAATDSLIKLFGLREAEALKRGYRTGYEDGRTDATDIRRFANERTR